jgi:hypothetical protein
VQDTERRIKLAFVCLMTAVGIPMIFAGEGSPTSMTSGGPSAKQIDPVNFDRLQDPWRRPCSRMSPAWSDFARIDGLVQRHRVHPRRFR